MYEYAGSAEFLIFFEILVCVRRDFFLNIIISFSMFVFLPSFEKERRKMNQKEERKTVVNRNGSSKIRSKSTSEF